jgi:probable F420-dependent oxidoreductase
MHFDIALGGDLPEALEGARAAEESGFAAGWMPENKHDALIQLAVVSQHTHRMQIGSSVAVAFARSPMVTAIAANDLQLVSGGRFILGLGSQTQRHIVERFAMPWSAPAAQMREYVEALLAIWDSWTEDSDLQFRGRRYTYTLMPPAFRPGANPFGRPRVFTAGIGAKMTQVAGEIADGLICHPFSSVQYLQRVTLPALEAGLTRAGRQRCDVEVTLAPLVVTGRDEEEFSRCRRDIRRRIANYAATPHRRDVLGASGLDALHLELDSLAKDGRADAMVELIDDAVLSEFAVVAEPGALVAALRDRYESLLDRVSVPLAAASCRVADER